MATELAKAFVQIVPSAKGIKSSLESELGGASESAGKSAGSRIGDAIKTAIIAAGIGKALKAAITEGMELEQNLSGTEAVFGEFAQSIQESATQAYRKMGTSASEYMATANKMGALYQGSGLEQQEALELTMQAMERATDVASVMGIDTATALESIAGAAKGNFTMMDNLGVAMNATTLQAYALEKGINFNWNTASNAEKARLAMQMFFEQTEQYAGNFARESEETLSGSMSAVKAAFQDVLGNLALGEDIAPSLSALKETALTFLTGNLLPAFGNILSGLPEILSGAFDIAIRSLNIAANNADAIVEDGVELVTALGSAILTALPYLGEAAFSLATALGTSLIEADWPTIGQNVITTLQSGLDLAAGEILGTDGSIVEAVLSAVESGLPSILSGGSGLVVEFASGLLSAIPQALEAGGELTGELITTILSVAPDILECGISFVGELGQGLLDNLPALTGSAAEVLSELLAEIGSHLPEMLEQGLSLAGELAAGLIDAIPDVIDSALEIAGEIVDAFRDTDWKQIGLDILSGIARGILNGAQSIRDAAWNAAKQALNAAKSALGIHSPSREFMWVGKMMDTGLAQGISDNTRPVKDAMDEITRMTTGSFDTELRIRSAVSSYTPAAGTSAPSAAALDDLRRKIASMRVYIYPDTLVGAIVAGVDESLADRNDMNERMVAV